MLSETYKKKKKNRKKVNENQVLVILKIGYLDFKGRLFRCNHVKFLKFFIQTTFFRFEITNIIKKFKKKKKIWIFENF